MWAQFIRDWEEANPCRKCQVRCLCITYGGTCRQNKLWKFVRKVLRKVGEG